MKSPDSANINLAQGYLDSAMREVRSLLDFADANQSVGLRESLREIREMIDSAQDVLENGY